MKIPQRYQILSDDELEMIHDNSMRIMEEVGVLMPYDHAKELLAKAGAKVEGDIVKIPRSLTEWAIKTAPSSYTIHSVNDAKSVEMDCETTRYVGPYGSPFVLDLDNGRHNATIDDFRKIVTICDALENIDIQSHISCECSDIDEHIRPLNMVYNTMRLSEKPGMGSIYGYENSLACIELQSIPFGGLEAIKDKPVIASIPCTLTPLSYDPNQLGAIRAYAETGQVQLINSLSIAGMTAPATLVGLVSVQNAEVLAGIVYAQLVREGCPVVYSASGSNAEMSNGLLSIGSPEDAIVSLINGQLCKKYQIPCRISGCLSDSKLMDAQAAYESAITLFAAQLAGGNFILHSAGIIESYNMTSLEKLVVDNEIIGYFKRIARGVEVNEETLAFDVIEEVGPQGTFLLEDHTVEHFREEFYQPTLSDRQAWDSWKENSGLDATQRANKKWHQIVDEAQPVDLGADVIKDMDAFVEKHYGQAPLF